MDSIEKLASEHYPEYYSIGLGSDKIGFERGYNLGKSSQTEISDDIDIIMELAEKSRNILNNVAHLCSGEVEEHIFDMGFYQGYVTKTQTEISDEEIEQEAFLYATKFFDWDKVRRESFTQGAEWYKEQLKKK